MVANAASSDNRVVVNILRVCGVRELCHASVRDPLVRHVYWKTDRSTEVASVGEVFAVLS